MKIFRSPIIGLSHQIAPFWHAFAWTKCHGGRFAHHLQFSDTAPFEGSLGNGRN